MTSFFETHSRHISSLRRSFHARKNLALILGAGVSYPLGFPQWGHLVKAIARDRRVEGSQVLKREDSNTSTTQTLFQHFRRQKLDEAKAKSKSNTPTAEAELEIKKEWRNIIHEHLYRKRPMRDGYLTRHPYLTELLKVVRGSRIVINYNFDDLIERALLATRTEKKRGRGFDTTWRFCVQGRSDVPLIYHPNGYLPENLLESPSEDLVFSEDSFADQLIDSMRGHYSSILHHLSQNTCLLFGLSLSDPTLKHLLRQHAVMHPGHVHYYIAHTRKRIPTKVQEAVRDAYFEVYNLVTLFLDDEGIRELLDSISEDDRHELNLKKGERKFVYYITGVPGVGKSSVTAHLWSLDCYDEWTDERLPLLAKKWSDLTKPEAKTVDAWIASQFAARNFNLTDAGNEGIHILDRCPLDPLSFCKHGQWRKKASGLLKAFADEKGNCVSGRVIVLLGDPKELETRARSRHKDASVKYFEQMQVTLEKVYGTTSKGVFCIATNGLDLKKVVKSVSRVVHLGDYSAFDCNRRLRHFAK